jgi:glucosamine--fructose-6-phosphate aminotransferase (isomerizing)
MCGIFGAIGNENVFYDVKPALERLSYRGYDSAGIAALDGDKFKIIKCLKHPENLEEIKFSSNVAIGHNRWATHGEPSINNAHPHLSNDKKIALVHNGIIENYSELKIFLINKGFSFYSDTDTEIIPNLIQYFYSKCNDIEEAIKFTVKEISGAYAIVFIHIDYKDKIFIVKLGSPVCIGQDSGSKTFICSDLESLPITTKTAIPIEDGKFVIVNTSKEIIVKSLSGNIDNIELKDIEIDPELHTCGKYNSFFEKEIREQVITINNAIRGRVIIDPVHIKLAGIAENIEDILKSKEVIFTGCGSALCAAQIGAFAMENMARIRSRAIAAGELKYYNPVIDKDTILIAVSQSGETADTLGCIRMAKERGAKCIGIVNVPNSAIAREVSSGIYIRAGTEVSVASTKAVTNQIMAMISMAALVASKKDLSSVSYESFILELHKLPSIIEEILEQSDGIKKIADKYKNSNSIICIGRNSLEPVAYEIALKIKELSYIHAEGYSAAELKHGPLALISIDIPTIALVGSGVIAEKILSNIREVKSRSGKVIAIIEKSECSEKIISEVDDYIVIPNISHRIISTIPYIIIGQLFALHLAELNNRAVDRPKNLAKSISVE